MRIALVPLLLAGCVSPARVASAPPLRADAGGVVMAEASASPGRLLRRAALLHLRTASPEDVGERASALVVEAGGWLVRRENLHYVFRVPAPRFDGVFRAVEAMGAVLHRRIDAEDVTEEVEGLELRLRNARALKDRYRALLAEAGDVETILRIEKELARVTETIERLEGRLEARRKEVAHVRFELRLLSSAASDGGAARSPFRWLRAIGVERLPAYRERYARSSRVRWTLPNGFADMGRVSDVDSIRGWAYSPDGIRIVVRRFRNRPRQSRDFWAREVARELAQARGYRARADGTDDVLQFDSAKDGRRTRYALRLVVDERYVTTAEVTGPEGAVAARWVDIARALGSLDQN